MLDADLFRFFCFDGAGGVDECFGGCCAVLTVICQPCADARSRHCMTYVSDLLHCEVCICRHTHILRLHVDDDE